MSKLRLVCELDYDDETMHGEDEEAYGWFMDILMGEHIQLSDHGDLGDTIGTIKVIEVAPKPPLNKLKEG